MELAQTRSTVKKWTVRVLVGSVVLAIGGAALYTAAALTFTYSDGERVGYVQKISRRGWICKTWEGDLSLVQVPGQQAPPFAFSVRDDKVAKAIEDLAGHKVALHYAQHKGVPTRCFGDTEYFVVKVERAD